MIKYTCSSPVARLRPSFAVSAFALEATPLLGNSPPPLLVCANSARSGPESRCSPFGVKPPACGPRINNH
ncbi:unnamed protein product [Toxocara canis]|uniref:Secreted protein n=1 Tax=Toxocara canis TaxID=6265 RepID=A0A183U2C6_TOXCA|nr:unnamed protein product [Toxocara canis]